jgi:hypothetical protein
MPEAQLQIDEVLLPLLQVSGDMELQSLLLQIVNEHADPLIKDIIQYKLRIPDRAANNGRNHYDAEDVYR